MELLMEIVAFKLPIHANLNRDKPMIVLKGMGYNKKVTRYQQTKN